MRPENFFETLKELQQKRPFRPFTVELVNGRTFQIEHPESLAYGGRGTAVYIGTNSEVYWFDHDSVADLNATSEEAASR